MCNQLLQGVTFYDQPDFLDLDLGDILTGDLIDLGPDIGEQLGDLSNDSFNSESGCSELENLIEYNIRALLESDDSDSESIDNQSTNSEDISEQIRLAQEEECLKKYRHEKYAQYNKIPIKEFKLKEHKIRKLNIQDLLGSESSDIEDLLETGGDQIEHFENYTNKEKICDNNRFNEILRSDSPDIEDFLGTKEENIKEILEFKEDIVQDHEPEVPETPCNIIDKEVDEIDVDLLLRPKSRDIETLLETNLENLIGFDEIFDKQNDGSNKILDAAQNTNLDFSLDFNNLISGNALDPLNKPKEEVETENNDTDIDKMVILEANQKNTDIPQIKIEVKDKNQFNLESCADITTNTPRCNKTSNPVPDAMEIRNPKDLKMKIFRNIKNECKENNNTKHFENDNSVLKLKSNHKKHRERNEGRHKKVSTDKSTNQSKNASCLKTSHNFMNFIKGFENSAEEYSDEELEDKTLEAHPERLYSCKMCKRSFNDAKYFRQHQRLHSRRRHSCTICGMAFAYRSDLKNHLVTHSDNHFVCCICSKVFDQQILLRDHVDFEHTQKPWKCMFCCIYLNKIFILSHKCISKSIKTPAAKRKKLEPRVHRLNDDSLDFLNMLDPGEPVSPGEFDCYGVDDEVISLKDVLLFNK